jgi:glycosyltransferase involved in cell wall biosynthesis
MPRDYFYELSARQVKKGHKVDVVTWNRDGHSLEEVVDEGFVIHRLPGLNFSLDGMIREYPFLPTLPAKIEMLNPDIVHAESHLFLPSVQAIRKAKSLGLPCVVSVHGVFADRGFSVNLTQFAYLHTLGLKVFRDADKVICLTKSDAKEVIRFGCPSEKIRIVPNAVDTELFRPGKDRENSLVVWVGRFVPEKGVEYLVMAARIVAERSKDVRFLLVGYGPLKARIMKLVRDFGLFGKSIYILGPLSREEIAEILSKASVFSFPSLKEGMPLSVLEAMASAVPVVGSNIPGINDVIIHGENGILVPPRNPEALANTIMLLLQNRGLRRKLGQNARQLMIEKYSWNVVIEKIERIYNEAIEEAEKS